MPLRGGQWCIWTPCSWLCNLVADPGAPGVLTRGVPHCAACCCSWNLTSRQQGVVRVGDAVRPTALRSGPPLPNPR